jgi:two-component system sensor histidine kinase KdpD
VFLGGAPGCGKTARLAAEAARLAAHGVDVVAACTALPGAPVEVVPPRVSGAHGLVVEDIDVEAVIRRAPRVCIVDDLARANAPGGRRVRRHADVEDLLAAGIDVVTALDVRNVESLAGVLRRATGIDARDFVPDGFLRRADEIVCVDAPVGGPSGDAAAVNPGANAQRELALREVAEWIARRRAGARTVPAEAGDRVLACIASASPRAETLVRRAAAIAGRLNTHWFVAHVADADHGESGAPEGEQRVLARAVGLARELGAEVVTLRAPDPVAAVVDFARSHGVTHVVVGRSGRRPWTRVFSRSFVNRLLDDASDLDVHVVATGTGGDASGDGAP